MDSLEVTYEPVVEAQAAPIASGAPALGWAIGEAAAQRGLLVPYSMPLWFRQRMPEPSSLEWLRSAARSLRESNLGFTFTTQVARVTSCSLEELQRKLGLGEAAVVRMNGGLPMTVGRAAGLSGRAVGNVHDAAPGADLQAVLLTELHHAQWVNGGRLVLLVRVQRCA